MSNKDKTQTLQITKRSFLQSVGMIGGTAAVMTAMNGWNIGFASEMDKPPELSSDGNGKKNNYFGCRTCRNGHGFRNDKKGI